MKTANVNIDGRVFNRAYLPYLNATERTQIFYGGAGSGKSVFLAQRTIIDLLRGGRNYLVCRAVARTVRRSVFTELTKVINQWNLSALFSINKSDGIITCSNGYQILFSGLDDTEKLKSITPAKGVITDVWVEEATEADKRSIDELYRRQRGGSDDVPKRMTLSFNPILKLHWIYNTYFTAVGWDDSDTHKSANDTLILRTWHVHNRFLTDSDKARLLAEADDYNRDVYTYGLWGVLGNAIFTNWETADLTALIPSFDNIRDGLDFGFSSDPAAGVSLHLDRTRRIIYVFGELYERGLTNDMLASYLAPMVGTRPLVADSAEPKSIAELQRYGIHARGARKGKDSILHGIQWLQQYRIVVDYRCVNAISELTQYHWAEDKMGNSLPRPAAGNDHIIDAMRYALEDDMLEYEAQYGLSPIAGYRG